MAGVCTGPGPCDTSPNGPGPNWVTEPQVNGLPVYIRAIAHALRRSGHSEQDAIRLAVGVVRRWARGEGKVTPATRARAAKALAEWQAKKAASHSGRGGRRDFGGGAVTESSSAGDLLPRGPSQAQARKIVREEQDADVPHAFKGSDLEHCSVCGMGVTAKIHLLGPKPSSKAAKEAQKRSGEGLRHRGTGHKPVPTGHIKGNLHRRRKAARASFDADATEIEKRFAEAFRQLFDKQEQATLDRLGGKRGRRMLRSAESGQQQNGQQASSSTIPASPTAPSPPNVASIFVPEFWVGKTAELMAEIYEETARRAIARVESEIAGDVAKAEAAKGAETTTNPETTAAKAADVAEEQVTASSSIAQVGQILTERANRMARDVTDTTHRQIQEAIAAGLSKGESISELTNDVRHVFDVARSRAETIARTETIGSLNEAANAYAEAEGPSRVERKEWMAHHDSRTRPAHRLADGQTVAIGQSFIVGGSLMAFPGDPTAPPDEVVNCRCSTAFLPPRAPEVPR